MSILFAFPGYEEIANRIALQLNLTQGKLNVRRFPDDESFVQIKSDIQNQQVIIVCGLEQPDQKAMALLFFSKTAREMGAKSIGLVTPYLGYMRQDKRFNAGEAVTSNIFAEFISSHYDWLITIDPHLHRHKSLSEIYNIPTTALHAADIISNWIKNNIANPVLIGPDEESEQWVADVATKASVPFTVLQKIRHSDTAVEVSVPDIAKYKHHTLVLIDDIISTGMTMLETIKHLLNAGMEAPICIGVHAIFANQAYDKLLQSGARQVITCNTIAHTSNTIDISKLLSDEITYMLDIIHKRSVLTST